MTFPSFLSLICFGSLAGPSGPAFLYRTFALGGLGGVAPQGCFTLWEVLNLDRWLAGLKGTLNLWDAHRVKVYNKEFRAEHPEYFDPDGILVFAALKGREKPCQ